MKRAFWNSFALTVLLVGSSGRAQAVEWVGAQAFTSVSAKLELGRSGVFGLRGVLTDLRVPSTNRQMNILYVGPTLTFKDRLIELWVAPQGVGAFNYFVGHDAFGPSLWATATGGRATFSLQSEVYFSSNSRRGYYGYYAFDTVLFDWLNTGAHGMQIDKNIFYGPHIGFKKGMIHIEARYLTDGGSQTVRLATTMQL